MVLPCQKSLHSAAQLQVFNRVNRMISRKQGRQEKPLTLDMESKQVPGLDLYLQEHVGSIEYRRQKGKDLR